MKRWTSKLAYCGLFKLESTNWFLFSALSKQASAGSWIRHYAVQSCRVWKMSNGELQQTPMQMKKTGVSVFATISTHSQGTNLCTDLLRRGANTSAILTTSVQRYQRNHECCSCAFPASMMWNTSVSKKYFQESSSKRCWVVTGHAVAVSGYSPVQ